MILGLTGGIGCGKSSVLAAFEKIGFDVVDADDLARALRDAPETVAFVRERFGFAAVSPETGKICNAALAKIIFNDASARTELENFMHPKLRVQWRSRSDEARRAGKNAAVEIPLLFEKNYDVDFDATVCVAASERVQLRRLETRGLPRERARERIAAQAPLDEKMRRADAVIFNDGSREFLDAQVRTVFKNFSRAGRA